MTIQYIMLVSLGFLIASLISLLLAPIFWHRAVRLTAARLRQSLPLTEQEILADKDQLRAKYAIRVHQLEKQVEQATLDSARQKIDLNRRDAAISQLESEIDRLKSEIEENQNARGVLEQTVGDRIPKIESRLEEARRLLVVRDREIADLSQSSRRQQDALNETRTINQTLTDEAEQLRAQLRAHEARRRKTSADSDVDGDVAIHTELELLRARTRDQASMIDQLNAEISVSRANSQASNAASRAASAREVSGEAGSAPALQRENIALQAQIESMKAAASGAKTPPELNGQGNVAAELRAALAKTEDQAAELARLKAEIAAFGAEKAAGDGASPSLKDNRISLKVQISGLEAKSALQEETIARLRAELAQLSERSTRQIAGLKDELRQAGIAAHVTQPRVGQAGDPVKTRASVAKRAQALFESAPSARGNAASPGAAEPEKAEPAEPVGAVAGRLGGRLLAPVRNRDDARGADEADQATPQPARVASLVATLRGSTITDTSAAASKEPKANDAAAAARQPRLLDRLTSADGKS